MTFAASAGAVLAKWTYKRSTRSNPGWRRSVRTGFRRKFLCRNFDLLLTSKITDKTSVLAEVVIGEGDAQSFGLELARALLKYDYNDHFHFSAGRYHTTIGFYNRVSQRALVANNGGSPSRHGACR